MSSTRILAVDPGRATGWAVLEAGRAYFGEEIFEEFPGWADSFLRSRFDRGCRFLVVAERFVISGGTLTKARGDSNWSIELIGVLRYLARQYGHEFDLQGAGDAKRFGTDRLLRKLGWWTPGSDHARDAARHLALALARRDQADLDRRLLSSEE